MSLTITVDTSTLSDQQVLDMVRHAENSPHKLGKPSVKQLETIAQAKRGPNEVEILPSKKESEARVDQEIQRQVADIDTSTARSRAGLTQDAEKILAGWSVNLEIDWRKLPTLSDIDLYETKNVSIKAVRDRIVGCNSNYMKVYGNKLCGHHASLIPLRCYTNYCPRCRILNIREACINLLAALAIYDSEGSETEVVEVKFTDSKPRLDLTDIILSKLRGNDKILMLRDMRHVKSEWVTGVVIYGALGLHKKISRIMSNIADPAKSHVTGFDPHDSKFNFEAILDSLLSSNEDMTAKDLDLYFSIRTNHKLKYTKKLAEKKDSGVSMPDKLLKSDYKVYDPHMHIPACTPVETAAIYGPMVEVYCAECDCKVKGEYFGVGALAKDNCVRILHGPRFGQTIPLEELMHNPADQGVQFTTVEYSDYSI